jgi:uncharacterized surface protein with fasciclin (FAS1) repeats
MAKLAVWPLLASLTATVTHAVDTSPPTLAELVANNENLTVLNDLVVPLALQILEETNVTEPNTLWAPINTAFDELGQELLANLLSGNWKEHARCVASNHITKGEFSSAEFADNVVLRTLDDNELLFTLNPPSIAGVPVIEEDVVASNGVMHIIEDVLTADCITKDLFTIATETGFLATVLNILGQNDDLAGILKDKGPYTFFAVSSLRSFRAVFQSGIAHSDNILFSHVSFFPTAIYWRHERLGRPCKRKIFARISQESHRCGEHLSWRLARRSGW